MQRFRRHKPFLQAILRTADQKQRQDLLQHANADQINAISELVLNLLKNNIPISSRMVSTLSQAKESLRGIGKRRLSVKQRRQLLQKVSSPLVWKALYKVFTICCRHAQQQQAAT